MKRSSVEVGENTQMPTKMNKIKIKEKEEESQVDLEE
jgi:hypothetical protein